jgi:putative ABC transport system permease protein
VASVASGVPLFVHAQRVTADFFAVFGLRPAAGRSWSEQENRAPVAVVGRRWAQDQFGDIRLAIGKTVTVYAKALEVIGVAAPGFAYPAATDIWLSAGLVPENPSRSGHNYFAIGKLKEGISLDTARQDMRAIGDRLEQQYKENRFKTVAVTPLAEKLTASAETTLWVLLSAVLGVLLIACANVANLQLARAASRSREMAVRVALGAGRSRILLQVLTESIVLGGLGAAAGLGVASLLLRALIAMTPADIPRLAEVRIDGTVLLFALALAVLCSILFGLMPARRSSDPDLNYGLRQNSGKGSMGRFSGRMRAVLVVSEVALSMVLLAGAGLLLRSFIALTSVDLGFSTDRLLVARMSLQTPDEAAARRAPEFYRDLISEIRVLPGVRRAAGVMTTPFAGDRSTSNYSIEGGPTYRPGEAPSAQQHIVTAGYFETIGIPLRRGRDFTDGDSWQRPQVAIINEALAREAFGGENPLGHRIRSGMTPQSTNGMEIIGVVGDARQIAPGEPARPEMFLPYLHQPFAGSNLKLIAQTHLAPYALSSAIRETARRRNPEVPVRFSTMNEIVSESLAYPRFRAMLIGCFAVLAACLAVIGIYGVISYVVGQRTNEIGLRFALGARPADVFRLVIGGSMRLVMWGLALGLIGTLALSRVLQTLLFGVDPHDPLTITAVLGALGLAALLGSSIPALRAARVDPLVALRQE